jgi:hypothetical protein
MRPDRVTKQDKDLEKGMVNALKKEDFYGKKPVVKKAIIIKKTEKPLTDKQRESAMIEALEKEDFYGTKPKKTTPAEDKRIKEVIENKRSEDIVNRIKSNIPMMRYKKK